MADQETDLQQVNNGGKVTLHSPTLASSTDLNFIQMTWSVKDTLRNILIRGRFDEYPDDKQMHGNARLAEMLDQFWKDLQSNAKFSPRFLEEEIGVLKATAGFRLLDYIPPSAFPFLLRKRVKSVSNLPIDFVNKVSLYLETVVSRVVDDRCESYPQLLPSMKKVARTAMAKFKENFLERVAEMLEMEKVTDYYSHPHFDPSWKKLMGNYHDQFVKAIQKLEGNSGRTAAGAVVASISVKGYGSFDIKHLVGVKESLREPAFDLKMRMTAHWEIVLARMVGWMALHLPFLIMKMVNNEMGVAGKKRGASEEYWVASEI